MPGADRTPRVRPATQQAQVIVRMSHDQRSGLHQLADLVGLPTSHYLLELAVADAERRGETDLAGILRGMVSSNGEGPNPAG